MANKDTVRKQNLRNAYIEKILAVEQQSDIGAMSSYENHERVTNDSGDYGSLFGNLFKINPEDWKESKIPILSNLGGTSGSWGAGAASSTGDDYASADSGPQIVGRNRLANDVTIKTSIIASDIEPHIKGIYKGKCDSFIRAGASYNVNPAVIAAIAMSENGGQLTNTTKKNNVGSITKVGGGFMSYPTLDKGIMELGAYLERKYVKQGIRTIEGIQKIYCPVGASNDPTGLNSHWLPNVLSKLNYMSPSTIITSVVSSPGSTSGVSVTDYKKVLSSININPDSYLKTGKIPLPVGATADYCNTMRKIIIDQGGVYTNNYFAGLLDGKGKNMFSNSASAGAQGMRLRKDMVYYLHELHNKVSSKLGVSKITISSGYRSPSNNASVGGAKNSMHMSAVAVDITPGSYKKAIILADAAYAMGFGMIAIGKMNNYFVHIDLGPKRTYKYSGVGKYVSPTNNGTGGS